MAIAFSCSCGRKINAKDEHAGKRVKCPGCQQPVTVPRPGAAMAAAAGGAKPAAARPKAKPAPAPADDDMYDMKDDDAPTRHGGGVAAESPWGDDDPGLEAAPVAAPRPYTSTAGSPAAAPARGKGAAAGAPGAAAAGGLGTFAGLGSKRGSAVSTKGAQAAGGLHLSGFAKVLIGAAVIIPVTFFIIRQGPVKAVAEWEKAEVQGDGDTHTVLARVIHDMDNATMAPPDPNEEPSGIPYHPQVSHFYYPDPPFVMWSMPKVVDVAGTTTFGSYKGLYYTRDRRVECEMEWKGDKTLQVVGKLKPDGNVESITIDGIESSDVMAISKKFDGYRTWKADMAAERAKLRGAGGAAAPGGAAPGGAPAGGAAADPGDDE